MKVELDGDRLVRARLQGPNHEIRAFAGTRDRRHPALRLATLNNMFNYVPMIIERATPDDAPAILALLAANALPVEGLLEHLGSAIVAQHDDRIVGCAALEIYSDGALLRSVAIDRTHQGRGIGTTLTTSALDLAATLGVRAVYLLTTTAEEFFAKFAFQRITRDEVPAGVRASVEFRSACPASAIVMRKTL